MKNKKQVSLETVFFLGVFVFLLVWFTRIHPLAVYDADDWNYISYARKAIPLWGNWNPSRVFPEVFMPLCSSAAVYLLMPLLKDYMLSLSVMHGLIVTLFIVLYLLCFFRMIKRLFSLSALSAMFATTLFLIAHFLVLRNYDDGNGYLFYCWDLTCYYYYLIPSLMNASIVMYMIGNREFQKGKTDISPEGKGLLFLILYFAVFSNLPASGILAVYAGSVLLTEFVAALRRKTGGKEFLKDNRLLLAVLLLWAVSAVFEISGGRAGADMGTKAPLVEGIRETLYLLMVRVSYCNPTFLGFFSITIAAAGLLLALSRNRESLDRDFLLQAVVCAVGIVAMAAYIVLLCAMVDLNYIHRVEYLFGLVFYVFLLLMLTFCYVIRKKPGVLLAVPVVLCILASECNTAGVTYLDSNQTHLDPEICHQIGNDFVDRLVQADQAGQDEVTLYIPVWDTPDNWPHAMYIGEMISGTLLEHGIISRKITVIPCPTVEYNEKFGLPIPGEE